MCETTDTQVLPSEIVTALNSRSPSLRKAALKEAEQMSPCPELGKALTDAFKQSEYDNYHHALLKVIAIHAIGREETIELLQQRLADLLGQISRGSTEWYELSASANNYGETLSLIVQDTRRALDIALMLCSHRLELLVIQGLKNLERLPAEVLPVSVLLGIAGTEGAFEDNRRKALRLVKKSGSDLKMLSPLIADMLMSHCIAIASDAQDLLEEFGVSPAAVPALVRALNYTDQKGVKRDRHFSLFNMCGDSMQAFIIGQLQSLGSAAYRSIPELRVLLTLPVSEADARKQEEERVATTMTQRTSAGKKRMSWMESKQIAQDVRVIRYTSEEAQTAARTALEAFGV